MKKLCLLGGTTLVVILVSVFPASVGAQEIYNPISALPFSRGHEISPPDTQIPPGLEKIHSPNTLLIFSGEIEEIRQRLSTIGVRPLHIFPPNALLAYQPEGISDSVMRENKNILEIFHSPMDQKTLEKYGKEAGYAGIAFKGFLEPSPPGPVGQTPYNDALIPPDYDLATGKAGIDIEPDGGPSPNETSLFFIRDASVNVILPESNGQINPSTEDWTQTEINQVISEVTQGLQWHVPRQQNAMITYFYHFYIQTPTGYEPINRRGGPPPAGEENLWIGEIMSNLGYGQSYSQAVRMFDDATRVADSTDWGFTIFVADSSNDPDGFFAPDLTGGLFFAYAYLAGPFLVMTYDNDGWTIDNMDIVTAHETAHIFQAQDEYYDARPTSSCNSLASCNVTSGFLNVQNQNCDLTPISQSCLLNVDSIMRDAASQHRAYPNGLIDVYARGKFGWWDQDSDQILDPIDSTYNQGTDADRDGIVDYWDRCPTVYSSPQNLLCTGNWSSDVRVSSSGSIAPTFLYPPSITTDLNGNVHIAWENWGDGEIHYKKLNNDGINLTPDLRLTTYPDYSLHPSLAVDSQSNIHVAWADERDWYPTCRYEIYYKKLDNNGVPLTPDIRLTSSCYDSTYPSIATDRQGNVHISWEEERSRGSSIFYKKLDNNGASLTPAIEVNPGGRPSLDTDTSGNIHIASYAAPTNYYRKLDNNGTSLTPAIPLTLSSPFMTEPHLATDPQGGVHVSWIDGRSGRLEIYYKKFDNNGQSLTPDIRLTFGASLPQFLHETSSLATDYQGNVHIIWVDGRDGNSEIYYKKLGNNGQSLTPDIRLTFNPALSLYPSLSTDPRGNVHVAWWDKRNNPTGEIYDVYYKRSLPLASISLQGAPRIGSAISLNLFDPVNYNKPYFLLMSLGNFPGIPLSDGRIIPLNPDGVFTLSLLFPGQIGLSNSQSILNLGRATTTWTIPNIPEIADLTVYFSFVTLNPALPFPQTITSISQAVPVTVLP